MFFIWKCLATKHEKEWSYAFTSTGERQFGRSDDVTILLFRTKIAKFVLNITIVL